MTSVEMHRPVQRGGGQDSRRSPWVAALAVMATAVIAMASVGGRERVGGAGAAGGVARV